jgi:hypothetical protein
MGRGIGRKNLGGRRSKIKTKYGTPARGLNTYRPSKGGWGKNQGQKRKSR